MFCSQKLGHKEQNQSKEIFTEEVQTLDLLDKYFKLAILYMLKELKVNA
jgi:hypothetical protein